MFPSHFGVVFFCLFFGVNGIWLAYRFLWHRKPALFWLASGVIVLTIGYLVVTEAAEGIARSLWPVEFDPVRSKEILKRSACVEPRLLATIIAVAPIMMPVALFVLFVLKEKRVWLIIPINLCLAVLFIGVFVSPIPERVGPLVGLDKALPAHCQPT
ncbi:MAG TPA: hypothetical protein VFB68_10615 [Xanthobacteraceae bacterium]|nr:hypothetical protein [Xanthobacteraceae bacterium]